MVRLLRYKDSSNICFFCCNQSKKNSKNQRRKDHAHLLDKEREVEVKKQKKVPKLPISRPIYMLFFFSFLFCSGVLAAVEALLISPPWWRRQPACKVLPILLPKRRPARSVQSSRRVLRRCSSSSSSFVDI
jgi:hypothetical protein